MHMFQENLSSSMENPTSSMENLSSSMENPTSSMENPNFTENKPPQQAPLMIKGQWTTEEDRLLVRLVNQYGLKRWSHIARMLVGRVGKQCRERWYNHLRPDIKKEAWTQAEERALVEAHSAIGNKWAEIAKRIPGRPENSIKNHWNATWRKLVSNRKCQKARGIGEPSVLQKYIKREVLAREKEIEKPKTKNQEHFALNNSLKVMESHGQEEKENYVPTAIVPASTKGDMNGRNETSGSNILAYEYGCNYINFMEVLMVLACPSSSSHTMETVDGDPIQELPKEFNNEDLEEMVSSSPVKIKMDNEVW